MTLDDLRKLVNVANNTRNADRWTGEEWIKLYQAYEACGWDFTPCQWAPWQVDAVLESGTVPTWNDDEEPTS